MLLPGNNSLVPMWPRNKAKATIALTSRFVRGLHSLEYSHFKKYFLHLFHCQTEFHLLVWISFATSDSNQLVKTVSSHASWQANSIVRFWGNSMPSPKSFFPSIAIVYVQALSNKGAACCFLTNHIVHNPWHSVLLLLLLLFQLWTLVSDFIIEWPCIPYTYIFLYEELDNYACRVACSIPV